MIERKAGENEKRGSSGRGVSGLQPAAVRCLAEWIVLVLAGAALAPESGLGAAAVYALAAALVGAVGRQAASEWTGRRPATLGPWVWLAAGALEIGLLIVLFVSSLDAGVLLRFLASLGLAGVFSWLSFRVGALTADGAAAATGVGGFVLGFGGWGWALGLVAFFVTSSGLSFWMIDRKKAVAADFAKTERRDAWQVLANGAVAAASAALAFARPDEAGLFAAGFLGALAAATGDTWGTEVGVLSRREPVLLASMPWRAVEKGTSGAVSVLGIVASAAGSLSIGLLGAFGFWFEGFASGGASFAAFNTALVIAAFAGGLAGSIADSLLGGTFQARYRCEACGRLTERRVHSCGRETRLSGGIAWFGNDVVNLAATIIGAATAAALYGGVLVNI